MAVDPETGEVRDEMPQPAPAPRTTPPQVAAAVVAVMKKVKQLGYDDTNQHQRYGFVSIDKFLAFMGPLLAEAGLTLDVEEVGYDIRRQGGTDRDTGNAKESAWLYAQYRLWLVHESGAMSAPYSRSILVPVSGPQAFGSAESYVVKRFLRTKFFVPTGDKDDADLTAAGEVQPRGAQTRQAARSGAAYQPGAQDVPMAQKPAPSPAPAAPAGKALGPDDPAYDKALRDFETIKARAGAAADHAALETVLLENQKRLEEIGELGLQPRQAVETLLGRIQDKMNKLKGGFDATTGARI
ncbi:MAG: ERF family protein [Pseudomonadota bacterium]